MNLIYVMRHGQSIVNVEHRISGRKFEGDLTELGREQAHKAANWFADKGIEQIIHSPFHRAEQTAAIVAERLKLKCSVSDDLCEMNCGSLEWRTDDAGWEAFYNVYRRWQEGDWNATYPDGESYRQGYERFTRCLLSVKPNQTTLLVTHGGISITVIPYLCVNAAALQGKRDLNNTGIVVLEPYGDGRYICRAWNETEHL